MGYFVDEKTVVYKHRSGGEGPGRPIFILDLESNTWREGPKLKYPRARYHVGFVTRSSGEKEVVFLGGIVHEAGAPADALACNSRCGQLYTKTVEIYNIANNTLRMGPDAPRFMGFGMTTQYMDSFLVSPSHEGDDCCALNKQFNGIYRYNDDDTLTLMPGRHPTSRTFQHNGGWWVDDLC